MDMRADPDALLGPLALVAKRTTHAVVITNADNRITWANRAFGECAGQPVAACMGRRPGCVLPFLREDMAARQPLVEAVASRQPARLRTRSRRSDGSRQWVDIDLQPLRAAGGAFDGYIAVISDVTELVIQNEQAQALLQSLPVGVVVYDNQLRVLQANATAARIFHLPLQALLGASTCARFPDAQFEDGSPMPPEERPAHLTLADGVPRQDSVYGLRVANGERRWLRVSTAPLRDAAGAISGVIACFADQTDEREQRRIFDLAVEAARIAPWHWNIVEDVARFDSRAAAAFGLRFASVGTGLQNTALWPAIHRDDVQRLREQLHSQQMEPQPTLRAEFRLPGAAGGWRWVMAAGAPAERSENGNIVALSGVLIDIDERKQAEAALQHAATTDALTGLPNRAMLGDRLQQALHAARRHGHKGGLLFIDLDHFKRINDVYGHVVGDGVLQAVGRRLQGELRAEDTLARMGGDELMVLLPDLGPEPDAAALGAEGVGDKLLVALLKPFVVGGLEYTLGASIGCTVFPKCTRESAEDLVREADTAMYAAKAAGRGMLRRYEPGMQRGVAERLALERDLRQALEHGEFSIHLQGKWQMQAASGSGDASGNGNGVANGDNGNGNGNGVANGDADGQTGGLARPVLAGAEVLLRWHQPQRGNVSPAVFIPVAEESTLILAIGRWVIEQACALQARWLAAGCSLPLAVNVSPRQFREPSFADDLVAITRAHGVPPSLLTLEITEGVLLDEAIAQRLQPLAALGFRFSIDDFGTGYSSLMYLKKMPVHELKIDRAFVRDLNTDPEDEAIVMAMLAIARSFRLQVVAEGVETAEQAEFLHANGCNLMQGYLFGRPVPVSEFEARMLPSSATGVTT